VEFDDRLATSPEIGDGSLFPVIRGGNGEGFRDRSFSHFEALEDKLASTRASEMHSSASITLSQSSPCPLNRKARSMHRWIRWRFQRIEEAWEEEMLIMDVLGTPILWGILPHDTTPIYQPPICPAFIGLS
jgi:hypothetical protein